MNILFVTWDGPQVNYLDSLFAPIFEGLQEYGITVHVLQFTWDNQVKTQLMEKKFTAAGVKYHVVNVFRRFGPVGPLVTALIGKYKVRDLIKNLNIDVVLARSTLPAFSSILALRKTAGVKFVFDADGLPLDERVDFSGLSSSSFSYRFLRDVEAESVRRADVILTRSKLAIPVLLARAGASTKYNKFHVVSNGRDAEKFSLLGVLQRLKVRNELSVDGDIPLLVYAGSLGEQYCLDEMLDFFIQVRKKIPIARFLILSGDLAFAEEKIEKLPELKAAVICKSVVSSDVPKYLAAADLGLAFRKKSFSMQAVAPIKIGEYLLCGLPVIATRDIGDTHVISDKIGRLVDDYTVDTFKPIIDWFVGDVLINRNISQKACRNAGIEHFSLQSSITAYASALNDLDD